MSSSSLGLSVVVPFHNESGNVIPLIHEIMDSLKDMTYEIIAVDDASTDATFQELQDISAQHPQVKVFRHIKNYGQSPALLTGAYQAQFSMLVTLDGDGQNDPADIPKLWNIFQNLPEETQRYTVVFGNREKRRDNLIRRWSSSIANHIRQRLLRDSCPDTGCALKLFPRDGLLRLPLFNHFHRFLPALFALHDYQMINVRVSHRPRIRGKSKYGVWNRLWVSIHDIFGVRWLMSRKCYPQLTLQANPHSAQKASQFSALKHGE
jgi:dolichol-phosphate mannosyltransferase